MLDSLHRRGRHAAPRGRARLRAWTLVAAAVVVLLLVALPVGRGTYALWNGNATTSTAKIVSGTATITVSTLSAMNTSVLAPGSGVVGTFTVKNTGTIPMSMRVATSSTSVAYAQNSTTAAVLGELKLNLAAVATASACRTGLGGASGPLASFDTGSGYYTLPVGQSAVACVEIDLASDAPQSVSGAVADFTLTVTGTQVGP